MWLSSAERDYHEAKRLRDNLITLRDAAGSDAPHVLLFNVGSAGLGTLAETVSTLMACVDALAARVAILENQ